MIEPPHNPENPIFGIWSKIAILKGNFPPMSSMLVLFKIAKI